jgi:predicted flap endonuclease-1-like 5' DNA nuclease
VATPQEMLPQTASAALEVRKEEMQAAPTKEVSVEKTSSVAVSAVVVMELTQVKGIGEKRALQLKALGINSVVDLSKASAQSVAKKLKISPKIVSKWIDSAKELVK